MCVNINAAQKVTDGEGIELKQGYYTIKVSKLKEAQHDKKVLGLIPSKDLSGCSLNVRSVCVLSPGPPVSPHGPKPCILSRDRTLGF